MTISNDKNSNNEEITGIYVDIMSLKELEAYLKGKGSELAIPIYQRPYVWGEKSVRNLFIDIYSNLDKKEYRLGTIILHNDERFYIVDGQQRLITLYLLLYILNDTSICLQFENGVDKVSIDNFKNNYEILKTMIKNNEKEKNEYLKYLKDNCKFAVIITDEQEEAFQFFDSQNSRGKRLAPHDYLKAYHLREMRNMPESEQEKIINQWENIKEKDLTELFADYLYPIIQWSKGKYGIYYDKTKRKVFEGISEKLKYNFAQYHICSNMYAEKHNTEFSFIPYSMELNQFQLTQPVIAGKWFFKYVLHYRNLLSMIERKVNSYNKKEEVPSDRTGDKYIKQLYICALLFFADRFNIQSLQEKHMDIIYKWSYSLSLVLHAIHRKSVNNYAKDKHDRLNKHDSLFVKINSMTSPDEILNTDFNIENVIDEKKNGAIFKKVMGD